MRNSIGNIKKKGQSLVEFALVLPILLLLIFGLVEFGRLIFTYTPRDFIDGAQLYGQPHLRKKMLGHNPLWHFGLDPDEVDGVLAQYGWRTVEHLGYDELDERYVKPSGRGLDWMAIERIVLAEKEEQ